MPQYIYWDDRYRIEVEKVDEQHQYLFKLINETVTLFAMKEADKFFFETLNRLIRYAEKHFREEEDFLNSIAYPDIEDHRKAHEDLVDDIFTLTNHKVLTNYDTKKLIDFMKKWICKHILTEDMQYKKFYFQSINKKL
jgi:hemerythrin